MKLSAAVGRRSSQPTPSKAFCLLHRVQKTRLTALSPAESGPTLRGGEKMSTFSDAGAEAVGMETDGEEKAEKKGPTPEQLLALRAAIANAATLEEVTRLEEALTSGVVPSDLKLGPE